VIEPLFEASFPSRPFGFVEAGAKQAIETIRQG